MNATTTAIAVLAIVGAALAQETPPPPAEASAQESGQAEPAQDESTQPEGEDQQDQDMPSLDELLGLDEAPEEPGEDPSQRDLEQALSGAQIGDAFIQAVDLMGSVATRIQQQKDTGIQTQRLQEDILRRLDQLIASIEQQQQQSSSSSSSSSSQRQQQQPNQPQQQQQQQRSEGSESNEHANAPELQEGPLRPDLDPVTAAWGNLPARIRDQLLQGKDDRFSALYESMTEAYYKRLAEEASQE